MQVQPAAHGFIAMGSWFLSAMPFILLCFLPKLYAFFRKKMAKAIQISIQLEVYQHIDELPETERYLLNRARQAASRAYAPYSNFLVGAALLTSEGKVVEGNNQENAAYPSGLCAERTALFAAGAMHPELQISMIAVSAKRRGDMYYTAANPCGACRQVIAEYQDRQHTPIRIIMEGNGEIVIANGIDSLLPFRFGQKNLLNS